MNIKEDFIKNTQRDFLERAEKILTTSSDGAEFFIFCVDVFGFRNINRVEYLPVNVSRLEEKFEAGDVVDGASLKAKGIIKHEDALVKVLGDGDITKALTVKVDKVSASAKAKIEAAGGKVEEPC